MAERGKQGGESDSAIEEGGEDENNPDLDNDELESEDTKQNLQRDWAEHLKRAQGELKKLKGNQGKDQQKSIQQKQLAANLGIDLSSLSAENIGKALGDQLRQRIASG